MSPNAVGRFRISVAPLREPKSGCGDRKRTYDTLGEARQAVAYSWSRTGCNLGVYKCRECGKFHITHRLEGHGDYVRLVSHPNFSGIGENGVNPGWDREGIRPRTSDEIAEERREFLAASASRKSRANRVRRRIRWHDSEGDDNL